MTDNEIIKALECCIAKENCEEISCEKCPLERCADCDTVRFINALELINRQKAEIEELRADNKYLFETMPHLKTETIKEFADNLCDEINQIDTSKSYDDKDDIVEQILFKIDNLLKEMAGDNK